MIELIVEKSRDNKLLAGLAGIVLVGLIFGGFFWFNPSKPDQGEPLEPLVTQSEKTSSTAKVAKTSEAKEDSTSLYITVDIKGAVQKPGVYELPSNSRVNDAINLAGGVSEQADRQSVNFAQKLSDEAVIYVATVGEQLSVVNQASAKPDDPSKATEKVNLNKATLADLQTISGIGQKRAQDILDYRDSNGGFQSVDELSNVSGIGDKTLERIRKEVSVD
ncbi:helix-hairpin-helix domain-containing protein [Streptococcus pluranimalium]|uniref:helix-hairpin-helix domain-containing protein n=1 Tax=Streptococcus pluranimalium TaxID=82348 RepID=UPI0039FD8B64